MKTFILVAILLCSTLGFSQTTGKSFNVEEKPTYTVTNVVPYSSEYMEKINSENKYRPIFFKFDKYGNKVIFDDSIMKIYLFPFDNKLKNTFYFLHLKFILSLNNEPLLK